MKRSWDVEGGYTIRVAAFFVFWFDNERYG